MKQENDAELVARARRGDLGAFDALVARHIEALTSFCRRMTRNAGEAEELLQESFIAAYDRLALLRDGGAFGSWLVTICLNKFRSGKRRERRETTLRETLRCETPATTTPSFGTEGELEIVVKDKLLALPERQREIMALHLYRDLSYRQIAELLGCTYEDVKVNISLARKALRESLADYLEER